MNVAATAQRSKSRPIGVEDYMPFGKHKGLIVRDVPQDYIRWALVNADLCNPDHERYWPELRATFEGLAGPHVSARPACLPVAVFCARLKADGISLSIRGGELVASEELADELLESLKVHANLLGAVLLIGQDTRTIATGNARSGQAAELRGLVKRWFNAMSQRFHPDAGGRDEHQVAINEGFASLKQMIREWELNP